MVRFAYVHVLEYFQNNDPEQLQRQCRSLLPIVASAWGRVNVLEWARDSAFRLHPDPLVLEEAVDEASRHGQVAGKQRTSPLDRAGIDNLALFSVLDFWLNSGLQIRKREM